MNTHAFFAALIAYFGMTLFVYFCYPKVWRRNRLFIAVLIIWHLTGLAAIGITFTKFNKITYETFSYEICRTATFYYIPLTIMAMFFLLWVCVKRTYWFVNNRTGRSPRLKLENRDFRHQTHCIAFILLSFAICVVGYFNVDLLRTKHYLVETDAHSEEESLDICLVSDIHAGAGTWEYAYDNMANQINRTEPDVIVFAGDVFDETTSYIDVRKVSDMIRDIRPPKYGIYYVYGNHDNNVDDWAGQQMSEMGVTVLKDEMVTLGPDIQLIGCLDKRDERALEFDELFAKLKPDTERPIIVLTHRPKNFKEMGELGCDLAMAGHTHGFNIPQYMGENLLEDMYYGRKQYDNMTAVVSSGVSAWGFHYKWPAQSEVVSIHLKFK